MKTKSFLIAIFDEDVMRRNLLHNEIDHMGYHIAYSSSSIKDFFKFFNKDISLAVLGYGSPSKSLLSAVRKINKEFINSEILVRICPGKTAPGFKIKGATLVGNCSFPHFFKEVEKLLPDHPLHKTEEKMKDIFADAVSHLIPPDSLFKNLVKDKEKLQILKWTASGKSAKEIADLTELKLFRINALRKQILRETQCSNMTEAVSKAKDYRLI